MPNEQKLRHRANAKPLLDGASVGKSPASVTAAQRAVPTTEKLKNNVKMRPPATAAAQFPCARVVFIVSKLQWFGRLAQRLARLVYTE